MNILKNIRISRYSHPCKKKLWCTVSDLVAKGRVDRDSGAHPVGLNCSSRNIHSDVNFTTKSNSLNFSSFQLCVSRGLHGQNKGDKHKIPSQIDKETIRQQAGATTESKPPGTGKGQKPALKPGTLKKFLFIRTHKGKIIALILGITGLYYYAHLVEDSVTGRRKFHLFSKSQVQTLGKIQSDHYKNKYKHKIETTGTNYNRVSTTVAKLMQANNDLPWTSGERSWEVFVVDGSETVNCYVMANGDVFVFSGLLEVAANDELLAAVLAHGISHVLLEHSAEIPTWKQALLSLVVGPLIAVHQTFPAFVGAIVHPILRRLSVTTMNRRNGKKLEQEADTLSIEMVSKACYDPRKVKEFWMTMEALRKKRRVELLWSHPNHKTRAHDLDVQMAKAFNILNKHCVGSMHPFYR